VSWNYLYGFPGERLSCYDEVTAIIPALEHLYPPAGVGKVRVDRYSPYFKEPDKYGIERLVPFPAYREVYQWPEDDIKKIAYHFTMIAPDSLLPESAYERLNFAIEQWISAWRSPGGPPVLRMYYLPVIGLVVEDTRSCGMQHFYLLSEDERDLLLSLERPQPRHCVKRPPLSIYLTIASSLSTNKFYVT
jgi:hypothetical protein